MLEVLSVTIIALILSYIASLCVTGFLGHSLFCEMQPNLLNEESITTGIQNNIEIENYLKLSAVETSLIYFCQFIVYQIHAAETKRNFINNELGGFG